MRPDPIFILGAHKSGTSLLRSLFDDIDNHYVIPIETHCYQLLNSWIRYPYRRQRPQKSSKEQFKKLALQGIQKANVNDDKYSAGVTLNWFDEKIFCKTLAQKLNEGESRKYLIDSYFESIYSSINGGEELDKNIRFIEKSVSNAEFAVDLSKLYPNAKFVYILRNPYSNIVSLRKYKSKSGYPFIDVIAKTLFQSYYFSYRNEQLIENYKIIRYEDLVKDTENTMKSICQFIDIPYDKKMIIPTKKGERWGGNSISDKKFNGVSAERLEVWKADIYPFEVSIVNKLFPHILERFQYNYIKTNYKKYFRCERESLKRYVINRLFLARAQSTV